MEPSRPRGVMICEVTDDAGRPAGTEVETSQDGWFAPGRLAGQASLQDFAILVTTGAGRMPAPVGRLARDAYQGKISAMIAEQPGAAVVSLVRLEGEIVDLTNERGWYVARCNRPVQRGHSGAPVFSSDGRIVGIIVEVDEGSHDAHILPSTIIAAAVDRAGARAKSETPETDSADFGHNLPRVERGSLVRAHLEIESASVDEHVEPKAGRYLVLARVNFTGRMRLDLRNGRAVVGVTRANLIVREERGSLDTSTVAFAFAPGETVDTWVRASGSDDPGRVETWVIAAPPSAADSVLEGDVFATSPSRDPRGALVKAVIGAPETPVFSGELTIDPNVIRFEAAPGSPLPSSVTGTEKKRLQLARRVLEKSAQSRIVLPVRMRP